jgi:hypothetical protein
MVMTMKKTTSLNISVAESEAKLDASSCHPLVGGEATTTLMARWLILAIYFRNLRIALFHKLSAQQAAKQPSTIIDQSTTYSSPHGISTSTYTDPTLHRGGKGNQQCSSWVSTEGTWLGNFGGGQSTEELG